MTDAELLSATRRDPGAFAVFYDRYETAIVGYFLRRTDDAELAADLTAEVFAAALGAAARYRPENRPPRRGCSRSRNTPSPAASAAARSKPEPDIGLGSATRSSSSPARSIKSTPRSPVTNGSASSSRGLPDDQQSAIRARILDEAPYPEIATRLETSELVIRKRVSRGLATLREQLEDRS